MQTDKLFMAISAKTEFDGLWIGAGACFDDERKLLQKVCDALILIKSYDLVKYKRILLDLRKIWITITPAALGRYQAETESCHLDSRFVASHDPAFIASVIVHEACHARTRRFGYAESLRGRLETLCRKQQYQFSHRHPGGEAVRNWLDSWDTPGPELYTDRSRKDACLQASKSTLREVGVPSWFVRLLDDARGFRERRGERLRLKSPGNESRMKAAANPDP